MIKVTWTSPYVAKQGIFTDIEGVKEILAESAGVRSILVAGIEPTDILDSLGHYDQVNVYPIYGCAMADSGAAAVLGTNICLVVVSKTVGPTVPQGD